MSFFQRLPKKESSEEVLKWDIEKEMELDGFENNCENNNFTPMINFTIGNPEINKKKSFVLLKQITKNTNNKKILRSKTAASFYQNSIDLVEVSDEFGNKIKIHKDMLISYKNSNFSKKDCKL